MSFEEPSSSSDRIEKFVSVVSTNWKKFPDKKITIPFGNTMHPTKVRHELLQLNGAKMLINGIQNHQSKIIDKIRDISWACCSTIITAAYKNLRLNIMQTTRGFFYTFSRINWVDGIVCYF